MAIGEKGWCGYPSAPLFWDLPFGKTHRHGPGLDNVYLKALFAF
jgi:hypothetical protein